MRMTGCLMICCVAAMMSPVAANVGVKVSFIEPERYTDAGLHSEYGAKWNRQRNGGGVLGKL
jgi:hypothetical protein